MSEREGLYCRDCESDAHIDERGWCGVCWDNAGVTRKRLYDPGTHRLVPKDAVVLERGDLSTMRRQIMLARSEITNSQKLGVGREACNFAAQRAWETLGDADARLRSALDAKEGESDE